MRKLLNLKWMATAAIALTLLVGGSREAAAFTTGFSVTSLSGGVDFAYASNPSFEPEHTAISLPDASADTGEIVSIPLVLTKASTGVAGFLMELSLADPEVASIVSVEFPEYGLTYEQLSLGSHARFAAADLFGLVEDGASDFTLAVVKVRGMFEGTTELRLEVLQMDDDNGDPIESQVLGGTFTTS